MQLNFTLDFWKSCVSKMEGEDGLYGDLSWCGAKEKYILPESAHSIFSL